MVEVVALIERLWSTLTGEESPAGAGGSTPIPEVVRDLRRLLGASLVLHITGVSAVKVVRSWADGVHVPAEPTVERLRLAHGLAALIADRGRMASTASWFQSCNAHLDGRSPAMVLREEPTATARTLLFDAVTTLANK